MTRRRRARLYGLSMFVFGVVGLKGYAIAAVGPGTYMTRLDHLASGVWLDRFIGVVMQPDPVSVTLAQVLMGFGV